MARIDTKHLLPLRLRQPLPLVRTTDPARWSKPSTDPLPCLIAITAVDTADSESQRRPRLTVRAPY